MKKASAEDLLEPHVCKGEWYSNIVPLSDAAIVLQGIIDQRDALLESCKQMLKHLEENDFDACGTPEWMINDAKAAIKSATE